MLTERTYIKINRPEPEKGTAYIYIDKIIGVCEIDGSTILMVDGYHIEAKESVTDILSMINDAIK